jgi:hypothetical protein
MSHLYETLTAKVTKQCSDAVIEAIVMEHADPSAGVGQI